MLLPVKGSESIDVMKTTCVLDIACQLRSSDVLIVDQGVLDHLVKTEA